MHTLAINYGGAQLRLEFSNNGSVWLYINNIERETLSNDSGTLTLNTTVQTEYEWHEFIEAIVEYKSGEIVASLWASKSKLDQLVIYQGEA